MVEYLQIIVTAAGSVGLGSVVTALVYRRKNSAEVKVLDAQAVKTEAEGLAIVAEAARSMLTQAMADIERLRGELAEMRRIIDLQEMKIIEQDKKIEEQHLELERLRAQVR